jgi:hypothetical protein
MPEAATRWGELRAFLARLPRCRTRRRIRSTRKHLSSEIFLTPTIRAVPRGLILTVIFELEPSGF